jgi:hypothetical protein
MCAGSQFGADPHPQGDGERFHIGLYIDRPQCNSRGKAHGGLISALTRSLAR